jgi:alanyl-tRNA synthetase
MTDRIYYTEPSCRSFEGTVTRAGEHDGRPMVVLDRTAFYPTSGGQPFDTGRLGSVAVIETIDAGDDIVHVVSAPMSAGAVVQGEIDWTKRFDHMQQHTGQHVLSAAFDRLFENRTTSFHMGAEVSTIDLAREATASDIGRAVDESNRVVWEDREVSLRFVSASEAARLPLRKEPAREGPLRLVEIKEFDLSACGGTHVHRTGVIGMIAVTNAERFRGGSRLTFVCGARASRVFHNYRDAVAGAVRVLSVLPHELPNAVERAQLESKDLRKTVSRLQGMLAGLDTKPRACWQRRRWVSFASSPRPSMIGTRRGSRQLPVRSRRRVAWPLRSCLLVIQWRSWSRVHRTLGSTRARHCGRCSIALAAAVGDGPTLLRGLDWSEALKRSFQLRESFLSAGAEAPALRSWVVVERRLLCAARLWFSRELG